MVRKGLIFVMILALISALPICARAYSVYTEGNISTTYLSYFEDLTSKIGLNDDYVFFRSGQNEYTMAVGDLDLVNGTFVGSSVKIYQIYSTSISGYNTIYSFSNRTENGFVLQVASSLVYSNLGSYPDLIQRNDYNEKVILLFMSISLVSGCITSIFAFGRRKYH